VERQQLPYAGKEIALAHSLRTRRVALVYAAGAVLLVGWAAYLGDSLPDRNVAQHWNAAWVGLDLLIVLALGNTAWRAFRADGSVVIPAAATAALLVADAWMDVTTATRADLWQSLLLALAVELPLAALSIIVARRALRNIAGRARPGRADSAIRPYRSPMTSREWS
jgi:hypothetical protein